MWQLSSAGLEQMEHTSLLGPPGDRLRRLYAPMFTDFPYSRAWVISPRDKPHNSMMWRLMATSGPMDHDHVISESVPYADSKKLVPVDQTRHLNATVESRFLRE